MDGVARKVDKEYLALTALDCGRLEFAKFAYTRSMPEAERDRLIAEGIAIGEAHACEVMTRHPGLPPSQIAASCGLTVRRTAAESTNSRYVQFASYYAKKREIHLNASAIGLLNQIVDVDLAEVLIAHELFHHYEMTEIGRVGKRFRARRLLLGFIPLTQSLLPVGEVAASAFCKKLSGLPFEPAVLDKLYFDCARGRI